MNRPIKFRVWDTFHKQWIGACAIELDGTIIDIHNAIPETNCIAQQYTGLIDKNGKEIYEGDIVKYNPDKPNIERIGIIEFSNYHNGWSIKDSHCYPLSDFGVYSLSSPFLSFNWTEIVGNIFEHSEIYGI